MIETALISGQENRAFYKEGDVWFCLADTNKFPAHSSQIRSVLEVGAEYVLLRNTTIETIETRLVAEKKRADGVFFTLATLDQDLTLSARVLIAQVAEELLEDPEVSNRVSDRLLSYLLPQAVRVSRHNLTSLISNFARLQALLRETFDAQPVIAELQSLWRESTSDISPFQEELQSIEAELIESGLFARVVRSIQKMDLAALNAALVTATLQFSDNAMMKSRLLSFRSKIQDTYFSGSSRKRQARLPLRYQTNSVAEQIRSSTPEDLIREAIDHDQPAHPTLGAFKSKARVDKQIKAIRDMLFADKMARAESYTADLVRFQLQQAEKGYAAKSLCHLTQISLEANQFVFATMLAKYAVELAPFDPVAFANRAEVFKQRAHFEAALLAYDEAIVQFPNHSYLINGKADVLHEMGRFADALEVYREAQSRFPDNPVAFCGEAGVLRSSGKIGEALQVALRNARRYPTNVVTRAVLAGLLAARGKYRDALNQYVQASLFDPANPRPVAGAAYAMRSAGFPERALAYLRQKIGIIRDDNHLKMTLASILRSTGDLQGAEDTYRVILKGFPSYLPAIHGLAAVGILMGRPFSLDDWEDATPESEGDWTGFRTYALSFVAANRPEESVRALRYALEHCPWLRERERIRAALGLAEMRAGQAESIRTLQTRIDMVDARQKQIRLLFLGHAHLLIRNAFGENNSPLASILLQRVLETKDPEIDSSRRHLLLIASGERLSLKDQASLLRTELDLAIAA
jgi:tetratricopeptide (TPR) repeat protein